MGTVIRMEHRNPDDLTAVVRADVMKVAGSVRAGATAAAIPYTTLDRRLRGDGSDFTVVELRRLAALTGRDYSAFVAGVTP